MKTYSNEFYTTTPRGDEVLVQYSALVEYCFMGDPSIPNGYEYRKEVNFDRFLYWFTDGDVAYRLPLKERQLLETEAATHCVENLENGGHYND